MGRGKGKAKKSSSIARHEDRHGEEEKMPVKRRGRPTKAHKEEETENINENGTPLENKRKKPSSETEESLDTLKDENGVGPESNELELPKTLGFRNNGSRRKNKPRRAAEVGVSVCEICTWLVLRS